MKDQFGPSLRAFLVCADVLKNSRNDQVISIINVFNELEIGEFPASIDTLCIVAVYAGKAGNYKHRFEIMEGSHRVGQTPEAPFTLEDNNAMFHAISYIDEFKIDRPHRLTFRALLNGKAIGETTLDIHY